MRTLFSWLHVADLGSRRGDPTLVLDALLEDAVRLAARAVVPDAIFVTGDLAYDGRDYAHAERWLERLVVALGMSTGDVFVVPGNHDVDLRADADRSVARLLRELREGDDSLDESLRSAEDRALLARRFERFSQVASHFGSGPELFWMHKRDVRGTKVRLVGLNTALLFTGKENGALRVGAEQLSLLDAPTGELVIALSHHPFDTRWLADANPAAVASSTHAHVHLFSASHAQDATPSSRETRIGAGGGLSGEARAEFHYNLGAIALCADGSMKLRLWPRRWSRQNRDFRIDGEGVPEGSPFAESDLRGQMLTSGPSKPWAVPEVAPSDAAPSSPRNGSAGKPVEYLSRVRLVGIGPLRDVDWQAPPGPGWNVVIGDNGAGKTTFLRAIAWTLLWPPTKMRDGAVGDHSLALSSDLPNAWVDGVGTMDLRSQFERDDASWKTSTSLHISDDALSVKESEIDVRPLCFSAGFGPFRRFTGGDPEYEKTFASRPRVARHLSLFQERVAMTETLRWLKDLHHEALEDVRNAPFIGRVQAFINHGDLLPNGVRLHHITSESVVFVDGNGCEVALEDLSDGYRSILSLTLELVRQLAAHYGPAHVFNASLDAVLAPGIVLIDEVDAHLHPTWQREIGVRLLALFPRIQFIVTTHSPLVCQAAADGRGTVFRLPRPGTDEMGKMLEGIELDRLVYGNVLDAYGTGAFGDIQRSEAGRKRLERLSALNQKELDAGLTPEEEAEQDRLRAIFPTARPTGAARG